MNRKPRIEHMQQSIAELRCGEQFYVNFLELSLTHADYIKSLVKKSVIMPDPVELRNVVGIDLMDKFIDGTFVMPQQTFIKL